MREIPLFLVLIFSQLLIESCASPLLNEDHHLLHSLKHVEKKHDIPLEFNIHSHEHSDIRRAARDQTNVLLEETQKISSDKFLVRRDESVSSQEVEAASAPESGPESIDKFDQQSYDFMLPEGKAESQTILAVVDFITRKNAPKPKIVVNFDEHNWFGIGEVQKTKADNADVYKATVVLKEGADVTIAQTHEGVYKFVVEAQQGDVVLATTHVVVEVLNLAPTTKRIRVTTAESEEEEDSTKAVSTSSSIGLPTMVTIPSAPPTMATETTTPLELLEVSTTTTEVFTATTEASTTTTEASTTITIPAILSTTTTNSTSSADFDLELSSSGNQSEDEDENEEEVEVDENDEEEGSALSTIPSTTLQVATTTILPHNLLHHSSAESQSSDELLTKTKSSEVFDLESPIDGPVTIIPLKTTEEGKIEMDVEETDAVLEIHGAKDGRIVVEKSDFSKSGDMVRGVFIVLKSRENLHSEAQLSVEPEGLLSIRPSIISANEDAGLFLNIPKAVQNNQKIEIVAKLADGVVLRQPLVLKVEMEKGEAKDQTNESKKVTLQEIELVVMENAESGKTIGKIEGDMKIVGEQERFSLVGNDIVLTCGQFDTEKCLQVPGSQKEFTLMLLPRNGTLAPLQVTIRVQQTAGLRTSDDVVRISDNRIIAPFAVITERTSKSIKLGGEASKFLGFRKSQDGLYQLIVVNSAASGKYSLDIGLDGDEETIGVKSIPVLVQNSLSHAHFRQPKYEISVDVKSSEFGEGMKLGQVELEGVPIDEAKIMILDNNPGWISVESYGGRMKVGRYNGKIYNGKYSVRVGAVDIKTWNILTETVVEVKVENGETKVEKEKIEGMPKSLVMESTFDREKSPSFEIAIESTKDLKIDPDSLFAIDENGKRQSYSPANIKISKNQIGFAPESLKTLRLVGCSLKSGSGNRKESLLIRLVSSPEYLETVRKNAARPVYPRPWTRENKEIEVEMKEELLPGQVVGVFPAVVPTTNEIAHVRLDGEMSEAFEYDEKTGELKIRQRVDFESLSEEQRSFNLVLTSGDPDFESEAILKVRVVDVDDNSPVISKEEIAILSLPEDLPSGAKIAEFDVTDPDGSESFDVKLSGRGSNNYRADITNSGNLSIFVADGAHLDREVQDSHSLILEVSDVSGNSDRIMIPIQLLDVNDNAPVFEKKVYEVEAVEDWPVGVILEQVSAKDQDLQEAGKVMYRIEGDQNSILDIDETTGDVSLSADLTGLARTEPYHIRVVASDMATPSMNSSAVLNLRIRSAEEVMVESVVEFLEPKTGFVLNVKENIPKDEKIYTVQAQLKGLEAKKSGASIEYSLKDLTSSNDGDNGEKPCFEIDKKSGDIFAVAETPIDYEKKKEYTLLVTATSSDDNTKSASTVLHIDVENLDDNKPEFLESLSPLFRIEKNLSKPTAIGRMTAYDADDTPVFYHILPTCGSESSSNFTIDLEFGEIVYHPSQNTNEQNDQKIEICILASSEKSPDLSDVFFDSGAKNMKKVVVQTGNESGDENPEMFIAGNDTVVSVGDSLQNVEIPMQMNMPERSRTSDFQLESLNFVPANYELGRDVISPEGSVDINPKTGEIVANGKIVDTPQGVFLANVKRDGNVAMKQLHHIKNDRKLKYVLALSPNEFGANVEKLKRQIHEALESESSGKRVRIYFDDPKMDGKNSSWTSVCFYITRDNAILDQKQMHSVISNNNGHISKLHHIFKVQDVTECAAPQKETKSEWHLPQNTLILIVVVALLILVLIALLVYVCCVARYRRHLEAKSGKMRAITAANYYKSPNFIGPPGYMAAPPPLPPPAIGYY